MKQINYDKVKYDIILKKGFTMIERQGPSNHLSTLKDLYRCQKDFK